MEEEILLEKINKLDQKLDRLMEFVDVQDRRREEFDDLVADASIVAKDAFKTSVVMLDKAQVELDSCGITCLLVRLVQNIDTFHELLDTLESAKDFMKDFTPIMHQVGLDAIRKMHDLDQRGYFDSVPQLISNLTDPAFLEMMKNITKAMTKAKTDKEEDILSMWQIFKQLRSKEVRKTISYALNVVREYSESE